ncbi:MAG: hypothetical protein ABH804_01815 [archaeon]
MDNFIQRCENVLEENDKILEKLKRFYLSPEEIKSCAKEMSKWY